MDVNGLWKTVVEFFYSTKLHIIVALILIDVILAIAAALRNKEFDFTRLGEFLLTMILPYTLSYLALHLVVDAVAELETILGAGIDTGIFLIIVASLVAAVMDNLKRLGLNMPSVRQANASDEWCE